MKLVIFFLENLRERIYLEQRETEEVDKTMAKLHRIRKSLLGVSEWSRKTLQVEIQHLHLTLSLHRELRQTLSELK